MVPDYIPSEFERKNYYHGISTDPPELLYRSDYLDNPFPRPTGRFWNLPTKTVNGVFNTPLNRVWDTVAPQILGVLRAQKIRYSALNTARFTTTRSEEGEDTSTVGPVVVWIATHPANATHPVGTTAEDAHRASADILAVLRANGVEGAVVEWIEGSVQRL